MAAQPGMRSGDAAFCPSMELQVVLPNESTSMSTRALVDLSRAAEQWGYTTAWLPDHVLPPDDWGSTFGGVYEPLVTMSHLMAHTERLHFGTSILIAPLRNPFVLARQVATMHELSNGRIVLGVGVGWSKPEFDAVGGDYTQRGAVTDDTLALLRHLFAGGSAPYEGGRFSYEYGVFAPVPASDVPIMVGGNSNAALRRAARYADVWQGIPADPEAFRERTASLTAFAGDRHVSPALRIGWPAGTTVREIVDTALAYRSAGAAQLAVHLGSHIGALDRMEALADALADQ